MFDNGVILRHVCPQRVRSPPRLCKVIPKRFMISLEKILAEVVEMAYPGRQLSWRDNAMYTGKFSMPGFLTVESYQMWDHGSIGAPQTIFYSQQPQCQYFLYSFIFKGLCAPVGIFRKSSNNADITYFQPSATFTCLKRHFLATPHGRVLHVWNYIRQWPKACCTAFLNSLLGHVTLEVESSNSLANLPIPAVPGKEGLEPTF